MPLHVELEMTQEKQDLKTLSGDKVMTIHGIKTWTLVLRPTWDRYSDYVEVYVGGGYSRSDIRWNPDPIVRHPAMSYEVNF